MKVIYNEIVHNFTCKLQSIATLEDIVNWSDAYSLY